jgi:hypothetical protein
MAPEMLVDVSYAALQEHELSMQHFIESILHVSYLYFPKGVRISIMSKTNKESNTNEYY